MVDRQLVYKKSQMSSTLADQCLKIILHLALIQQADIRNQFHIPFRQEVA
jgi:hypothetical protein